MIYVAFPNKPLTQSRLKLKMNFLMVSCLTGKKNPLIINRVNLSIIFYKIYKNCSHLTKKNQECNENCMSLTQAHVKK
jgi:hypothetical protein